MPSPSADHERLLLHELTRLDLDTETLVVEVTEVLDTLRRTLDGGAEPTGHLVLHNATDRLTAALSGHDAVELIGAPGELAIPQTHHVIKADDASELPSDTVLKVVALGVRYRGGVLRPASVIVSSGKGIQQ